MTGRPNTQPPECTVDGCDRKPNARGMCKTHYNRWLKTGSTDEPFKPTLKPCTIDGCTEPNKARGWCTAHYERWRRHGDPHHVKQEQPRRRATTATHPEPRAEPQPPGPCTIDGCDQPRRGLGYCNKHYKRWRKHGDPNIAGKPRKHVPPPPTKPAIDPPEHLTAFLAARRARLGRNNAA